MRTNPIGHTIFLTSEEYRMTNQKTDTIFFTSDKIRIVFSRLSGRPCEVTESECFMVHTDLRPFFSSTFQGLFQDKSHFFKGFFFPLNLTHRVHVINPYAIQKSPSLIVSLAVHIDCFACASRFLSAILARSRPYLRRQLSCHTIDTLLFACPL